MAFSLLLSLALGAVLPWLCGASACCSSVVFISAVGLGGVQGSDPVDGCSCSLCFISLLKSDQENPGKPAPATERWSKSLGNTRF